MSRNRTWYTDMNVAASDVSTAARATISSAYAFKEMLKGTVTGTNGWEGAAPAGSLWTHQSSCDSVTTTTTAGNANDLLGNGTFNAAQWVRSTAHTIAHSWGVYKNAGSTMWILLSLVGANDATCISLYASTTAFTGGSPTVRPTATKEWVCWSNPAFSAQSLTDIQQFTDGLAVGYRFHMCKDANGEFYFAASKNGSNAFLGLFGFVSRLKCPTADLGKYCTPWLYSATGIVGFATNNTTGTAIMGRTSGDSAQAQLVLPMLTVGNNGNGAAFQSSFAAADYDGKAALLEQIALANPSASYVYRGVLPDLHVILPAVAAGLTIPATGNIERVGMVSWTVPFSVAPLL
jgi:hypothetical protein